MALVESESLILKSYNLSEADKIVVFISRDHGVVRGVAKGARRLQSRFGSSLEPFSVVKTSYLQKDAVELVNIQSVEIIESNFSTASNPAFLEKFAYLADLLIALSAPHDPNETLFRMAKTAIRSAGNHPAGISAIGVYFEIWLLRLSGILPDWTNCNRCGRSLRDAGTLGLRANFHLLCESCQRGFRSRAVGPVERDILRAALQLHPEEFLEMAHAYAPQLEILSGSLKLMISTAIGRDITEKRMLSLSDRPS